MTKRPTLEYHEDSTLIELLVRAESSDDVYEHVDVYRRALRYVLLLLYAEHYGLHPHYGNTSARGLGVGGSTITQQCNLVRPNDREQQVIWAVDDALHQGIGTLHRQGVDVTAAARERFGPLDGYAL